MYGGIFEKIQLSLSTLEKELPKAERKGFIGKGGRERKRGHIAPYCSYHSKGSAM